MGEKERQERERQDACIVFIKCPQCWFENSASLVFADFKMFIFLHQFLKIQQVCLVVIYFRNLK